MWKTQFSQLITEMIAPDQYYKMICMLLSKVEEGGGRCCSNEGGTAEMDGSVINYFV